MESSRMHSGFVSVIIPVYKDQLGLDGCLNALLKQSWPSNRYEIIVVDNASDPPIRIGSHGPENLRLKLCLKPGAYAARNVGIAASRGDVLAFTDADCLPDPNWISAGVAAMERNKGCCIVGGEVILSCSQKPTAVELYQHLNGFMQRENVEHRGFSVTANMFVAQSLVQRTGAFNESLFSGGDLEWCWRAMNLGYPIEFAREATVRTSPRTSLTAAIRQARRVAGGRGVLRKMKANHISPANIKPHRSALGASRWILTHPDLAPAKRLKVFTVAAAIKAAYVLECLRLKIGSKPERC